MNLSSQDCEAARLTALRAYGVLDTPPESGFEHITSLVTRLFAVPIAAVTLVDAERQWFKSIRGLDVRETPRDVSFCAHAMLREEVMVVPDAALDPRFADNPLVTGEPGIRFYAGAPLRTPEGQPLGALCLIDYLPRQLSRADQEMLSEMAALVEDELLLRRVAKELREETLQRQHSERVLDEERRAGQRLREGQGAFEGDAAPREDRFRRIVEQASDAIFVYDLEGNFTNVNAAACRLMGYTRKELLQRKLADLEIGFDFVKARKRWEELAVGEAMTMEGLNRRNDGSVFWAEVKISTVETEQGRVIFALVRDITQRKQAERLLQLRAGQQQAVAKLSKRALWGGNLQTLLEEAVEIVSATLDLEVCRVLEYLPDQGELVTRAGGRELPAPEVGKAVVSGDAKFASNHVLHTGHPVIVKDAGNDHRFQEAPWLQAAGAVSGLEVSIGGDGSRLPQYGLLAAYTTESRGFTEDDVYFVQSIANILATAIVRQRNEDALRVVETRYRRIAANTPGVVYQYLHGADGVLAIPFISESCRSLYGREPKEVQAAPEIIVDSIHPDDRPGFKRMIHAGETALQPLHWQGRHILPSGEVRWVRFDSRPERQPDGSVICDGIIIDVTDEENRREALRQSEERFRRANFHAPFPTMLHADDGEVIQLNDAWIHLTGYRAEEIPTVEDWLRLAYPSEEVKKHVRGFVEDLWQYVGAVAHPGLHIRCAGGEIRTWDFSCASLGRLPDGRFMYITTATDVTERNRAETELREAKEEAEEANRAKTVFLSRMSHELRTPLNAILGFGQLLELGATGEQSRESTAHILKGGKHLLSLVNEVLDLARVESGELELHLSAISCREIARDCIDFVSRIAHARGVTCSVHAHGSGWQSVLADGHRLRQVLLNLLSNAINYNRSGGKVLLSYEQVSNDYIRLEVKDTGPGISPEHLTSLFVPFERLGQEKGGIVGTGLGLVVSKHLVEAMDGRIGVESKVGHGSTFWVELPMAASDAPPKAKVVEPATPAAILAGGASLPATLIYIEDNVSNLQVVKMIVERMRPQWTLRTAPDGLTGLQQVRESLPDLVLLDLHLPGLSGDLVLSEIRADESTRHIPVLLLTADAMVHSREHLLSLGASDHLSKPFIVSELLDKLDRLVVAAMQLKKPEDR